LFTLQKFEIICSLGSGYIYLVPISATIVLVALQ
jgi:hypothetical protein